MFITEKLGDNMPDIQIITRKEKLDDNEIYVYHVHGRRQYYGTCKIHLKSDCVVLKNWNPGKGLGKTIMKDHDKIDQIPNHLKCKKCFKI